MGAEMSARRRSKSKRRCPPNARPSPASLSGLALSSQKLAPFLKSSLTFRFESLAAIEVAVEIELLVKRGVDRSDQPTSSRFRDRC